MRYWIARPGGKPSGPFDIERIRKAAAKGSLPKDALACEEGSEEWTGLHELLASAAPIPPRGTRGAPPTPTAASSEPPAADTEDEWTAATHTLSTRDRPPRAPSGVASAIRVFLWIAIIMGALGVGLTIAQMVALRDGLSGLPYAVRFEQWRQLMGCFGLVLLLPLLILWRIWMYQTTAFASNLGVPRTSHSPAWAAWCGLIPFAGPWLEVQVLREVWQVSINPRSWRAQAVPNATLNQLSSAGTAVWIGCAMMLAIGMASALPRDSIAPLLRGLERHLYDQSLLIELNLRMQLLLDLAGLAQASYALKVLHGVNARQTALALRLDAR